MLSKEDLLRHYPFRYEDLTNVERGIVVNSKNIYTRAGKTVQKIMVKTDRGVKELTYFNQPYLVRNLTTGVKMSLAGNEYEINGPLIHTGRLVPIYPETKGVTSKMLRRKIWNLLKQPKFADWLPGKIIKQNRLVDLDTALRQVHFPDSQKQAERARQRLAFDEMLQFQLLALKSKKRWQEKQLSHRLTINRRKINQLLASLPYILTPSQTSALGEILDDLSRPQAMNRLLQGEVGSGKTVVAAVAMYAVCLNGFHSALMAPTEILAQQHYQTLKKIFEHTAVKVGLVTKSAKETGDILVGTHALLFKKIIELGLLVIDEQHRFGVRQRVKLLQISPVPHLLSMTATPIPRTLALTAYAHLNLSQLKPLPGKQAPKTWLVPESKRPGAYSWIGKQIRENQAQVFFVCPLIDPSQKEKMQDIKAVNHEFDYLKLVFNEFNLALIHGRIKAEEKKKIIENFSRGKIDILVATPVIEVGIDIPGASIIVVENAERFGLAQLHQLRGRVGRRGQTGYCLLFGREKNDRLKILESVSDGLKLAEMDLQFRGPGEWYGLAQHGFLSFKLADPFDLKLVTLTKKAAEVIIASCRRNQKEKSLIAGPVNAAPALN